MDRDAIVFSVRKLKKKILGKTETEFENIKELCSEKEEEITKIFNRLRKYILDDLNDCERFVKFLTDKKEDV